MEGGANVPADFIKQLLGRPVVVKLNSGVTYQGFFNQLESNISFENIILKKIKFQYYFY